MQINPILRSPRRILLFIAALACWAAAVFIVVSGGLPERAAFTGQIIPGERPVAPELNAIAPPFEAVTLTGTRINLLDLRGSVVLINFWATWCEPCRVEMPELQTLYERYQAQELRVLAVNLGEEAAAAQSWVEAFGLTFEVLLDPQQQIAALYYLRGQPSTYVVSPDGIITHISYGPASLAMLEAAIAPFMQR
jgi:peroxiredoxin